jgi:hypothetical protein
MNAVIENIFSYHAPTPDQVKQYERLRQSAKTLAYVIEAECPAGREKSLAMTNLENALMWANAAIARWSPAPKRIPGRD